MKKVAFVDRDGAVVYEPSPTSTVDSVEQLRILPGVIKGLRRLREQGYLLVMVTNQDGLGTRSNPRRNFDAVQERLFELLRQEGIEFYKVFVCPHFPKDKCLCRKPKIGMVVEFLQKEPIDRRRSLMVGDRSTDGEFANNLGVKFFKMETNGSFPFIV